MRAERVSGGRFSCRVAAREKALQGKPETARFAVKPPSTNHGQSEEETTSQDVETQTPEAPQGEPSQEAHLAKIGANCFQRPSFHQTRFIGGFFLCESDKTYFKNFINFFC